MYDFLHRGSIRKSTKINSTKWEESYGFSLIIIGVFMLTFNLE